MMYKKKNNLFLLAITLLLSCQKVQETPSTVLEEKLFRLEQMGWKSRSISHFIADIAYKATWVPSQYYLLKNEGSTDLEKVDSLYTSIRNERVIEVEFQQENNDDLLKEKYTKRSYQTAVKHMAFNLKNDFQAVTKSGDTISCSGVTFERNFKVAPFKRVLLFFGNIPEGENFKLLYNDRLFSNGLLQFNFTETPIKL